MNVLIIPISRSALSKIVDEDEQGELMGASFSRRGRGHTQTNRLVSKQSNGLQLCCMKKVPLVVRLCDHIEKYREMGKETRV